MGSISGDDEMKKIVFEVPHLAYRVEVRDASHPSKDGSPSCEHVSSGHIILWIPKKLRVASVVAHEAMHAIQFMSMDRNFDITLEQEHSAYLMQYVVAKVMGFKLVNIK